MVSSAVSALTGSPPRWLIAAVASPMRPDVGGAAVGQGLDADGEVVAIGGAGPPSDGGSIAATSPADSGGRCTTSKRAAASRSSAMRARDVAARARSGVGLSPSAVHQIAQHVAQAGEVLEGAHLEHLVEQERRRVAVGAAGAAGRTPACGRRRRGRSTASALRRARRRVDERRAGEHGVEEAFGRGGGALDVDVLAARPAEPIGQRVQQRGAAGAAAAEHHRNARGAASSAASDAALQAGVRAPS